MQLRNPISKFDRKSIRTVKVGRHGGFLRVGCPKGKFKKGRCKVGMKAEGGVKYPKARNPDGKFNWTYTLLALALGIGAGIWWQRSRSKTP